MTRRHLYSLLICVAAWVQALAAPPTGNGAFTIVEAINQADGTIYIYQPQALDAIVSRDSAEDPDEESATAKLTGYRVQVFSDNNMRTAKANAEHRKRLIEQQTEYRAYMTFDSPYWRVRVGDFRTQSEADAAMRELKAMFPTMADDFRLVRERVNAAAE
ncbi:MAG: SPOR domain-containing protein [Bacteroidales bacterium]|nr:SPOR domain-containing protein [Bacteroidales bacterium]